MKIKTEFLDVTVTNGYYPGGIKLKDVAKDKLAEIADALPDAFEVAAFDSLRLRSGTDAQATAFGSAQATKKGKMEEVGKGDL